MPANGSAVSPADVPERRDTSGDRADDGLVEHLSEPVGDIGDTALDRDDRRCHLDRWMHDHVGREVVDHGSKRREEIGSEHPAEHRCRECRTRTWGRRGLGFGERTHHRFHRPWPDDDRVESGLLDALLHVRPDSKEHLVASLAKCPSDRQDRPDDAFHRCRCAEDLHPSTPLRDRRPTGDGRDDDPGRILLLSGRRRQGRRLSTSLKAGARQRLHHRPLADTVPRRHLHRPARGGALHPRGCSGRDHRRDPGCLRLRRSCEGFRLCHVDGRSAHDSRSGRVVTPTLQPAGGER